MGKRKKLFLICIFLFCSIELAGIPLLTYGIKGVINAVTSKNYSLFWMSMSLIIIKHVVWSVYSPLSAYLCDYASKGGIRDFKVKTIKHIIKLPQSYHDLKANGELLSFMSSDTDCLQGIYDWSFFQVIRTALQGFGGIIMMAIIDWRFAIVVFVLGTTNVYIISYFSKKLGHTGEKLQESLSKNNIDALELMKATKTIRLLKLSNNKKYEFESYTEVEVDTRIKSGKISSRMNAIITGLNGISYLAILAIGSVFVFFNLSDWGTVVALTGLKGSTDCLFSECGQHMAGMQTSLAGVKRLLDVLAEKEESFSGDRKFIIAKDSIPLRASNINFSYDGEIPVLKDVNISIEVGKLTALVGESGCGKSSLMKLLLALYEPDSGSIYLSGNGIVTIETLRSKTAYVPQDPMLFSGTVFDNITCGCENGSITKVISAAKAADADEFIESLPEGYETIILEDGKNFSGGQKQRIAIARALYKDAPILLLDEITAALDNIAEQNIMETVCNISKVKAIFVITHKPDIAAYADKVYNLDK